MKKHNKLQNEKYFLFMSCAMLQLYVSDDRYTAKEDKEIDKLLMDLAKRTYMFNKSLDKTLKEAIDKFIDYTQRNVEGIVNVKMLKYVFAKD